MRGPKELFDSSRALLVQPVLESQAITKANCPKSKGWALGGWQDKAPIHGHVFGSFL